MGINFDEKYISPAPNRLNFSNDSHRVESRRSHKVRLDNILFLESLGFKVKKKQ